MTCYWIKAIESQNGTVYSAVILFFSKTLLEFSTLQIKCLIESELFQKKKKKIVCQTHPFNEVHL